MVIEMTKPRTAKRPKLTDAERYKRFLEAAKVVGASDDPADFERAFARVVAPKTPNGKDRADPP
jgi:hypothetical protein